MRIFVCLAVLVAFASAASRARRQLAKERPFEAGQHETELTGSQAPETISSEASAEQELFPKQDINTDVPPKDKPKKKPASRRHGMGPMGMGMPPMMGHPGMMGPQGMPMHPMMGPQDMSHMPQGSGSPFGMPHDQSMMPSMGQQMPMRGMRQGQMPEGQMFGGPMDMQRGRMMGPGFPPGFGPGNFTHGSRNGMPPMGMGMSPQQMAMMRSRGMPPMMASRHGGQMSGRMPPMMQRSMSSSMHGGDDSMMQHGMPPMMHRGMPSSMHGGDDSMMQHGMPPMMHRGMPSSMHGGDESMMQRGMPPMMQRGMPPMMQRGMPSSVHDGDESMMQHGMHPMMQRGMPPMMHRGMPPMMSGEMPPREDRNRGKASLMASVLLRGPSMSTRKPHSEDRARQHEQRSDGPTPLDLLDPQDDADIGRFLQFDGQIETIRKSVLNSFYKDLVTYRAISKLYQTKMLAKLTLIKELEAKISMPVRGHVAISSTTPHMPVPPAPQPMEMEGVRVESSGHYPPSPFF